MNPLLRVAGLLVLAHTALAEVPPFAPVGPTRPPAATTAPNSADNAEIQRLYQEDQADRQAPPGQSIDWSFVIPRDLLRQKRVKEIYRDGQLHTGSDYYLVAMVLQHGKTPEDFLLAHELCIVAISKGEPRARWLAAASEDRFLMAIGRPQRFGTQHGTSGGAPAHLTTLDDGVTNAVRRELNVPVVTETAAR